MTVFLITGYYSLFWRSENSRHILQKKVLLITHLPIFTILNAAELMIHLEIQGCLDGSSFDYDIAVTGKRLLFHKGSLLQVTRILL